MSIARALVEKHGKIAAVVFPLSVMGGFAYTMATGSVPVREQQAADGKDQQQSMYTLNFKLGGIGSK